MGRTRRKLGALAILAATTMAPRTARAQSTAHAAPVPVQQGFAIDRFDPAPRGSDWFVLDSLDMREDARGSIGVVSEYAYKPLVVSNADGSDRAAVVAHQLYVHPGASLIILDRVRLWFDVPVAVYNQGTSTTLRGTLLQAPDKPAVGDSRIGLDIRMFGTYGEIATGAIGLEAIAPTGSTRQYTGDGAAEFLPRIELAGLVGRVQWAARGGVLFRIQDPPIAGQSRGDAAVFGAAVGYRSKNGKLVVGPELYGSTSLTVSSSLNTPIEALLGAHYMLAAGWRVGAGVGPGFAAGLGSPLVRTALSLEYATPAEADTPRKPVARRGPRDHDRDEVPDTLDACPDTPGVETDDPATNGCPPPPDTDKDGIADDKDACPEEPGAPSADPDWNGCPPDADEDGVPDSEDACPLRAGVEQTDKTQNGCPPDSDRDGIIDEEDACPDVKGAKSDDPKRNGCPLDPDRDHDGIENDDDACPDEPGPRSPDPHRNGCPKAVLRGKEIRILDQVRFEPNSARISAGKDSEEVLRAIAKIMVDHAEIKKVEVQGHTDNRGDSKANQRLSQQRAGAVLKWLVKQGLDAARFTAVGYGDQRPLDSNLTDAGRKANRRVELHVLDAGEGEK